MSWNTLPFELQRIIFNYISNQRTKKECQIVCKSWSRSAQQSLYKQIYLGKNAMRFLSTIEKATPQCGTLVKSITFRRGFTRTIKHSLNAFESIIKFCPQVEEIHTITSYEEELLWSFLISDKIYLEHLQVIATSKRNFRKTRLTSRLYSQVADKFKETLTTLELNLNRFSNNRDVQLEYDLLSRSFKGFASLKELYFVNCVTASIQDLDNLFNNCHPKAKFNLSIDCLCLSQCNSNIHNNINRIENIQNMIIENAKFSPTSFDYFSLKFKELKHLDIHLIDEPSVAVEQWWKQFINFFRISKRYNICIGFSNIITFINQLEVFLNILTQILDQHITKAIHISVDFSSQGEGKPVFEINQSKCHILLKRNEGKMMQRIFQCLCKYCSPNEISVEFKGRCQANVLKQVFCPIFWLNRHQHYSKFLKICWEVILGVINTIESGLASNISFTGIILHGDPSSYFTHLNQSSKKSLE
jgi:hypothetical protein